MDEEKHKHKHEHGHHHCHCSDDYDEMSGMMLCLADKAWEAAMKEHMKDAWKKHRSKNMSRAAEVAVKHSMDAWAHKKSTKDMKADLPKEEIDKFRKELEKAFQE